MPPLGKLAVRVALMGGQKSDQNHPECGPIHGFQEAWGLGPVDAFQGISESRGHGAESVSVISRYAAGGGRISVALERTRCQINTVRLYLELNPNNLTVKKKKKTKTNSNL